MFCQLMHGKDTESISTDKDTKGYADVTVLSDCSDVVEQISQHKCCREMFCQHKNTCEFKFCGWYDVAFCLGQETRR